MGGGGRLCMSACPMCVLPPQKKKVDQVTRLWLDIGDAWRGTRHVVQVRAQEEFGHGAWSEWSREAVGTPWTGNGGWEGGIMASSPPRQVWGCAVVPRVTPTPPHLTLQSPAMSLRWDLTARR